MRKLFGRYLSQLRSEQGLTLADVADRLGCSTSHYCDIELGRRRPTRAILDSLPNHLGLLEDEAHRLEVLGRAARGYKYQSESSYERAYFLWLLKQTWSYLTEEEVETLIHLLEQYDQAIDAEEE